jgi:hypothetical protein
MTWLLVAAAVLLGAVAFRHFGSKPARHRGQRAEQFERFLTTLELGGRDGGLLFIEHEGSECFVQFVKLGDDPNDRTSLSLGFPDAPWSRTYYPAVREALTAVGIPLTESQGATGMQFLEADHLSVPRAAEAARRCFAAMEVGSDARFTLHFAGTVRSPEMSVYKARLAEYRSAAGHA